MITSFAQTTIHFRLISRLKANQIMYWAARGANQGRSQNGSGRVRIDLKVLSQLLRMSVGTLRQYCYRCVHTGLFRSCTIKNNVAVIFYSSLNKVAQRTGLDRLGEGSRIKFWELSQLKYAATLGAAEAGQRKSRYAKRKEISDAQKTRPFKKDGPAQRSKVKMDNLDDLFNPNSCDQCRSVATIANFHHGNPKVEWIGKRGVFVTEGYTSYGMTQKAIGKELGVSESTVQRRLSNTQRNKLNRRNKELGKYRVPLVAKLQVFKKTRFKSLEAIAKKLGVHFDPEAEVQFRGFYKNQGRFWKACPNYYYTDSEIAWSPSARRRYAQYLRSLPLSELIPPYRET